MQTRSNGRKSLHVDAQTKYTGIDENAFHNVNHWLFKKMTKPFVNILNVENYCDIFILIYFFNH